MADNRYQVPRLVESIELATRHFRCAKVPAHSKFEFICVAEDCNYNRLVCTDCERLDSKHMQLHGPEFLRLPELLKEVLFAPNRDIEDIRKMLMNINRVTIGFDAQREEERGGIRDYFKRLENELIIIIKRNMKRLHDQTIDAMQTRRTHIQTCINKILQIGKELSVCDGVEYLRGIEENLKLRYQNPTPFLSSLMQGLKLKQELPAAIEDWSRHQIKLKSYIHQLSEPVISNTELDPINLKLRREVEIHLESVNLELIFDSQHRLSSSHKSILRDESHDQRGFSHSKSGCKSKSVLLNISSGMKQTLEPGTSWRGPNHGEEIEYDGMGRDLSEAHTVPTLHVEKAPRVGQNLRIDQGLLEEMVTPIRANQTKK